MLISGTTKAFFTIRGSALSTPSTSVQISIKFEFVPAAIIDAVKSEPFLPRVVVAPSSEDAIKPVTTAIPSIFLKRFLIFL